MAFLGDGVKSQRLESLLFMVIDEYDRGMSESLNGEFELLNLE
jgi:hypothetical protein